MLKNFGVSTNFACCGTTMDITFEDAIFATQNFHYAQRVAQYLQGPGVLTAYGILTPPIDKELIPDKFACPDCKRVYKRGDLQYHVVELDQEHQDE